jgi:outer membrane receptor protein involved in Fe transport
VISTVDITDVKSRTVELQLIQPFHDHTFILGASRFTEDWVLTESTKWSLNLLLPEPPYFVQYLSQNYPPRIFYSVSEYENLYFYNLLTLSDRLRLTLGVTQEKLEHISELVITETNPKFGLTWEAYENLTLRAAYMENLASPYSMSWTLEPTHIAGFNQLMPITGGTKTKVFGLATDAKINRSLFIGTEYQQLNQLEPMISSDTGSDRSAKYNVDYLGIDNEGVSSFVYWSATKKLSMYFSYGQWRLSNLRFSPEEQITKIIEFGINYHWPSGFYLLTDGEYIDQKLIWPNESIQSNFWNVDLSIRYRFPKRYGRVELMIKNLFDETIEINGYQAGIIHERSIYTNFTINI